MKLDSQVAEFCKKLYSAARTPSLDSLLQFLSLSVFECLENEFWKFLNIQRSLRPNLISFPFSAELKKETIFSFSKASTMAPGASVAVLGASVVRLSFCQKRLTDMLRIRLLRIFLPILPIFDPFWLLSSITFQIRPKTPKKT